MRVGIIGCAGHYRFAVESAQQHKTCEIAALASPGDGTNDAALRELAAELRIPFYEDWRQMLDTEALDLVEVDNRYDLHAACAIECLQRSLHVYCEKPLATTLDDLDRVRAARLASGKALGGMFNLRWTSWFLAVQQAIEAGEIGEVRLIHGQKSYKFGVRPDFYRERAKYGGTIPWVAIHALDWCLALGGHCHRVSALQSARGNHNHGELEMTALIQMELDNEVFASVSADFLRPTGGARHDDDRIRVTGTRGMIEVKDGVAWLENDLPRRALPLPPPGDPFGAFVRAISGKTDQSFADQAVESTRISLLAREAADQRRTLET